MNFIPLVVIFITLFGALSFSLAKHQLLDQSEAQAYSGRLRALRMAHNERIDTLTRERRKKLKKESPTKASSHETKQEPHEKPYFRLTRTGAPQGAINLAPLLKPNKNNSLLKEKTIAYLQLIYGNVEFIQALKNPSWIEELLDAFIAQQQESYIKNQTYLSLKELTTPASLKSVYSLLLKGTHTFDPIRLKGYLPLESSITFKEKGEKAIHFPFANPAIIKTFFGKEFYDKLEETEWPEGHAREPHHTTYALNEKECAKLLGDQIDYNLFSLFDFNYRRGQKQPYRATDSKTGITAQVLDDSR